MSQPEHSSFSTAVDGADGTWKGAPDWFSFSSLTEAEACPRRWALSRATYPDVWSRTGYPPLPHHSALVGDIVHGALERIVKALVAARCTSASSAEAVAVLRDLGGYSAVLLAVMNERTKELGENPRLQGRLDQLSRQLRERLPEMRQRTQSTLSRTELVTSAGATTVSALGGGRLPDGAYPEFELRSSSLGWAGRADLIVVDGADIHVLDYKTGAPHEHHGDQLRVYALLWARRDGRHPDQPMANRLTLSYATHDEDVAPPTAGELDELEAQLLTRTAATRAELSSEAPEARPEPSLCGYCPVRQLCDVYWSLRPPDVVDGFVDVELAITGRNGPKSFHARLAPEGPNVILRSGEDLEFVSGSRVRVLGAHASRDEERDIVAVSLTASSEVFPLKGAPRP